MKILVIFTLMSLSGLVFSFTDHQDVIRLVEKVSAPGADQKIQAFKNDKSEKPDAIGALEKNQEVPTRGTSDDLRQDLCSFKQEYSGIYLTLLVGLITVGLTVSLFILTVIGWFPDLSSSSKHVCQAYSILSNMVSTLAASFVILSTFVPTANSCSVALVLVHLSLFMFVTSDLLLHLDFYLAIVAPFWHEEVIAASENISLAICGASLSASVFLSVALYFVGPFKCPEITDPESMSECPLVVIMNLTKDGSITAAINVCVASLFSLVLASSCHVFIIALQKIKANSIAPTVTNSRLHHRIAFIEFKLGFGKSTSQIFETKQTIGGLPAEISSSSCDSEAPLAEASDVHDSLERSGRNAKEKERAVAEGEKLGRALTKSFRYNLVNILTYGLFLLPSLGNGLESSGYGNILGSVDHVLGGQNGIFLASWLWKTVLIVFIGFRTAQPIILAKSDKTLQAKIKIILSDDVED